MRDLFEAGDIRAVHAEDGRVRFELAGEDGVGEALVYIADDQYALLDEGDWQPAEVGADGVLRWEEAGARPSRSRGWRRASFSSSGVRRMREACFSKSSFTARAEWIIMGT